MLSVAVTCLAVPVMAKESCESLKTRIETKLAGKGIKAYTLAMIAPGEAKGIDTEKVNARGQRVGGHAMAENKKFSICGRQQRTKVCVRRFAGAHIGRTAR